MATLQVVTPQGLGGKHWRKASDYRFAAHEALCPLVAQEFPKAALAFTIGFQAQGTGYQPVAVLGLVPGQNLYVSPDGRWVASYLPAVYRAYPFKNNRGQTTVFMRTRDKKDTHFSCLNFKQILN